MNKVHKSSKGIYVKQGFFNEREVRAPLCDGIMGLYAGKEYQIHRNWAAVTCKNCLKKRVKKL